MSLTGFADWVVVVKHKPAVGTEGQAGFVPAGPFQPVGSNGERPLAWAPILEVIVNGTRYHAARARYALGTTLTPTGGTGDNPVAVLGSRVLDPRTGELSGESIKQELGRRYKTWYDRLMAGQTVSLPGGGTITVYPSLTVFLGDTPDPADA